MSLTALLFVFFFLSGCVAAFARHPVYGLVTYVGVFYVHPPSRWWGQGILLDVRWSLMAAAVTLIAVLIYKPKSPVASVVRSGAFWGFVALLVWIAFQSLWALDAEAHADLLTHYIKFLVVIFLFCRCIDTEQNLRLVLWAHVLGCFYLGWIAFTSHAGGRFEDFGGPGIGEANTAALQMVTGIVVAGSLFLVAVPRGKVVLLGVIPIIVNALVTTISRSGFLSAAVAGLIFNLLTPAKYRVRVRVLSLLALVLFALLTNPVYWARMDTLKHKGEEVEGVDTGAGRLLIIEAQWKMFKAHPLGCGHMCTTTLSPSYLDASELYGGGRASHNTFMTMLVDHGIFGGAFYIAMLFWIFWKLRIVASRLSGDDGFLAAVLPAVGAVLGAIIVGDLFVQYPKFEARFWFVSILMVLLQLTAQPKSPRPPT